MKDSHPYDAAAAPLTSDSSHVVERTELDPVKEPESSPLLLADSERLVEQENQPADKLQDVGESSDNVNVDVAEASDVKEPTEPALLQPSDEAADPEVQAEPAAVPEPSRVSLSVPGSQAEPSQTPDAESTATKDEVDDTPEAVTLSKTEKKSKKKKSKALAQDVETAAEADPVSIEEHPAAPQLLAQEDTVSEPTTVAESTEPREAPAAEPQDVSALKAENEDGDGDPSLAGLSKKERKKLKKEKKKGKTVEFADPIEEAKPIVLEEPAATEDSQTLSKSQPVIDSGPDSSAVEEVVAPKETTGETETEPAPEVHRGSSTEEPAPAIESEEGPEVPLAATPSDAEATKSLEPETHTDQSLPTELSPEAVKVAESADLPALESVNAQQSGPEDLGKPSESEPGVESVTPNQPLLGDETVATGNVEAQPEPTDANTSDSEPAEHVSETKTSEPATEENPTSQLVPEPEPEVETPAPTVDDIDTTPSKTKKDKKDKKKKKKKGEAESSLEPTADPPIPSQSSDPSAATEAVAENVGPEPQESVLPPASETLPAGEAKKDSDPLESTVALPLADADP
ncbi:hypothetical protein B0I35DRAFT_417380, partial [Stachybotrys elegans]